MHVVLQPSPSVTHRYRVTLPNQRTIDFGERGLNYYPDHGNPKIMRAQLLRKGAIIPKELRVERDRVRFIEECCESKKVLRRIGKISSGQNTGNAGYFILTLV